MKSLSGRYGVSRTAIEPRLRAAGIPIRGRIETNRAMADARTPEENMQIMAAAHRASRGVPKTLEQRTKSAQTREFRKIGVSDSERALARMLKTRGIAAIPQKAIGPYNVDLAAGTVAVEIFGGGWHAYGIHKRRTPERLRYILDEGWNLLIIWDLVGRWPIDDGGADYVAAFVEETSSDPAIRGQYRVIWGDGKAAATDGVDVDDLTVKPSRSAGFGPSTRNDRAR